MDGSAHDGAPSAKPLSSARMPDEQWLAPRVPGLGWSEKRLVQHPATKTGFARHRSHALRIPFPATLRLALSLGHPTGQDNPYMALTVQEPHERSDFSPTQETQTIELYSTPHELP